MLSVNCPKTRNEEFGQLLEALTEKYCQTVMKLDELIIQFDTLKGKNDKVIKFQEENFHKHDSGLDSVVGMHKKLEEKQVEDHQRILQSVEAENAKLKEIIADQETKLENILKENVENLQTADSEQKVELGNLADENKVQNGRIDGCDSRLDDLKGSLGNHSEMLENIFKELKEKDAHMTAMGEKIDKLMKERDGGNDLIKGEFDEKIKKVYEEVETKAALETVNTFITKNSEDIAGVKTAFNQKVSELEAKQIEIIEKQTASETKIGENSQKIENFNSSSVEATNNIKVDQEVFKDELKTLKTTQEGNEKKRISSTEEITETISTMNQKQSVLSTNFGSLEEKVSQQMDSIDKKTEETQNNLKDLQHVTNTFDDKVANFSKSLRMEFRETKDDMVKKIDEHVQLAIQDSRARNEDLEDRITSSIKKQENFVKSLETKFGEIESGQKKNSSNCEGEVE